MMEKLRRFLTSLWEKGEVKNAPQRSPAEPSATDKASAINKESVTNKTAAPNKTAGNAVTPDPHKFRKDYYPLRKLIIWGTDENGDPGLMILYGYQKFRQKRYRNNELEDHVTYTDYMVFQGKEGHFPAFEAVEVYDHYDYRSKTSSRALYYKKDITQRYGRDMQLALKEFRTFQPEEALTFPYYEQLQHTDYVQTIMAKKLSFGGFRPAASPAGVLQLETRLQPYYEALVTLFANPKLYIRKKCLKELLDQNPTQELIYYLLQRGSSELVSGLLMELAKRGKSGYEDAAEGLLNGTISWTSDSYGAGIKRCADLYLSSLYPDAREGKIQRIYQYLEDMDLTLVSVNGKKIPEEQVLEGRHYHRYYNKGYLAEYTYHYDYESRRSVKVMITDLYKKTHYCDGTKLDIVRYKAAIQEAELYGLSDALGKIAYFIDAPRVVYHLKGVGKGKALRYFQRYLRRIFESCAQTDENSYVDAMQALFAGYQPGDYVNAYAGNFQTNYFISKFLYYDYNEKAPDGWRERFAWVSNDQHLKLNGRYEYKPEIWDRHLQAAADILAEAKLDVIGKAFFYILTDEKNHAETAKFSFNTVIRLACCSYPAAAEFFMEMLKQRLEQSRTFEFDIMVALMDYKDSRMRELATGYFERTGGKLSPESIVRLFYLEDPDEWLELIGQSLSRLNSYEYLDFIKALTDSGTDGRHGDITVSDELADLLEASLQILETLSDGQREALAAAITAGINNKEVSSFVLSYMEKVLFAIPFQKLLRISERLDLSGDGEPASAARGRILAILGMLKKKQLLSDAMIIQVTEAGSAKMIRILIEALGMMEDQLFTRFSTVTILLESQITALQERAAAVFEKLPGNEQKKLHAMLLDSPKQQAYEFALRKLYEIYEERSEVIPAEFVLPMLEHPAVEVRTYISGKMEHVISNLGNGNQDLFLYYAKTLLYLPNRSAAAKAFVYRMLPLFAAEYKQRVEEVSALLLDLGCSNQISDSEQALVALANIKKEVSALEG